MSEEHVARASDGTKIAFDVTGSGEPLLLLAGQANSRAWWTTVRADFAEHTTIAPDLPGTGHSDEIVDGDWSTRRFARDAIAVLDDLGIERAHVYGTSMGGRVAQWIAIDHPDRVGSLILGCTTGGGAGAVARDPAVSAHLSGTREVARRELERLMVGPQWRWSHPGPLDVLGDDTMSATSLRGHRRASEQHDAWDALPGVESPTLVLHGSADELTPPANGVRLADRIPGAELRMLTGARHAYFLEYREHASALVNDFVGRYSRGLM